MKLSDAMTMGTCLGKLEPGNWKKCVLGRPLHAVGARGQISVYEELLERWPWLESDHEHYLVEIIELFDQRVCNGDMAVD